MTMKGSPLSHSQWPGVVTTSFQTPWADEGDGVHHCFRGHFKAGWFRRGDLFTVLFASTRQACLFKANLGGACLLQSLG